MDSWRRSWWLEMPLRLKEVIGPINIADALEAAAAAAIGSGA